MQIQQPPVEAQQNFQADFTKWAQQQQVLQQLTTLNQQGIAMDPEDFSNLVQQQQQLLSQQNAAAAAAASAAAATTVRPPLLFLHFQSLLKDS